MKREKEIKNSKKLEINKISENFFLNKNLREKNSMKLEISKTYRIGENTFSSLEEANLFILTNLYNEGLEAIIANPTSFSEALRAVTNPSAIPQGTSVSKPSDGGNMRDIQETLRKEGYRIGRHEKFWPVYEVTRNDGTLAAFRFTGKVWELYNLICEVGIEEVISKYSYNLL